MDGWGGVGKEDDNALEKSTTMTFTTEKRYMDQWHSNVALVAQYYLKENQKQTNSFELKDFKFSN